MSKLIPSDKAFKKNPDGSYSIIGDFTAPKITGTALGAIVGKSKWDTPFSISAKMLGLFREDISDNPSIKAGVALEPVILEHLKDRGVIPAEKLFDERKGPHEQWKQDFENPIFGGHVDGITEDGKIVEIKTTTRPEDWVSEIPEHYWLQASLYAKFMGSDTILFGVGVLDEASRADPSKWNPQGNVVVIETGLHPDLDAILEVATDFYKDFLAKGRTFVPNPNDPTDEYIVGILDSQLIADEDAYKLACEYEDIMAKLEETQPLQDRADAIKTQLMMYMKTKNQSFVCGNHNAFKRLVSARRIVDTDALKKDGLYDMYTKTTEVEQFRKTRM